MTRTAKLEQDGPRGSVEHAGSPRWRKIVRQLAGGGLLLLGLAGLALPILPGWVFIAWGVVTLAPDIPLFGRLLDRVAQRVPRLRAAIDRIREDERNGSR